MKRCAVLLIPVVLLTGGCSTEPAAARDASGAVTSEGTVDAFEIALGDCVDEPADAPTDEVTETDELRAVPCDRPHDGEVYAVFDLPDGEYPGDDEVMEISDERCLEDFEAFVGLPYDDSVYDLSTLFPTADSWRALDDREVVCMVVAPVGETVTGTLEGARA